MQTFLKTIVTLSQWYSLDSSRWVLSDEYPHARVPVIFLCVFLHYFALAKFSIGSSQLLDLITAILHPQAYCTLPMNAETLVNTVSVFPFKSEYMWTGHEYILLLKITLGLGISWSQGIHWILMWLPTSDFCREPKDVLVSIHNTE